MSAETSRITNSRRTLIALLAAGFIAFSGAVSVLHAENTAPAAASTAANASTMTLQQLAEAHIGLVDFDPAKVVGSQACANCHASAIAAWEKTPHSTTWDTLHRRPEAQAIAEKMGLRSIKRGDVCIQCHYTQKEEAGRITPVSGVSCESCHGPAADWITIHNNYGGPNVTKATEPAAHATERINSALAAGMLHPDNLYLVAQNCYNCHTVPNEELVNVGGHKAGTQDFELVSYSQGMVRHNYARDASGTNAANSQERLRVMYVLGAMVDLEYSLRGLAKATSGANYARFMAQRVDRNRKLLRDDIQTKINNPHVQAAVDAAFAAALKLNNEAELTASAETVAEAARAFSESADGAALAAVDPLVPGPDAYKGTPSP